MESAQPDREAVAIHLSVRPSPHLDPPFEDEIDRGHAEMDMLPLPACAPSCPPVPHRRPPCGRPVGRREIPRTREPISPPIGEHACSGRAAVRRFAGLCIEVVNGFRPVSHLRQLTAPARFSDVASQIIRHVRSRRSQQPVRIRRILVCEPAPSTVEAAIVLDRGGTCWAMAMRLERTQHGWQCCVLSVV